jgi:hypothetical protein
MGLHKNEHVNMAAGYNIQLNVHPSKVEIWFRKTLK